jgi:N-acetylmuramoyl-L-alanine amidase
VHLVRYAVGRIICGFVPLNGQVVYALILLSWSCLRRYLGISSVLAARRTTERCLTSAPAVLRLVPKMACRGGGVVTRTAFIFALWALLVSASFPVEAVWPLGRGIDLAQARHAHDRARVIDHRLSAATEATLHRIRTVVIDPGHGGDNEGAIGVEGVAEKHVTLELAYEVRARLQRRFPHLRVVLTRYWDDALSLSERIAFANRQGADIFLSLHYNAAVHQRAVGFETYFLSWEQAAPVGTKRRVELFAQVGADVSPPRKLVVETHAAGLFGDDLMTLKRDLARGRQHVRSGVLAGLVQGEFVRHLSSVNRGVKQANFGVLRGALMPAVVIEAGFLTHPREGRDVLAKSHRDRVAGSIVEAIVRFDETLGAEVNKPDGISGH